MDSKYKVITIDLIKKIDSGFFKKGDKFYSESQLRSIYNVSSTTAVKVMDNLVALGKVERFQGKGTFITKNNNDELLKVSDLPLRNELVRSIDVISIKEKREPEIQKKLHITGNYYELIRIYYIGENTVSDINFSYVPIEYVKSTHLKKLRDFNSIYKLYNDDFDINAYTLPFTQDNSIKDLPKNFIIESFDPDKKLNYCFYQERTTFLPDGSVLEYINDYKNPNLFAQRLKRGSIDYD